MNNKVNIAADLVQTYSKSYLNKDMPKGKEDWAVILKFVIQALYIGKNFNKDAIKSVLIELKSDLSIPLSDTFITKIIQEVLYRIDDKANKQKGFNSFYGLGMNEHKPIMLKDLLEDTTFSMDLPNTFAKFLVEKWKKGELDQYFGQAGYLKKWREESKVHASPEDSFEYEKKWKHKRTGEKTMPGKGGKVTSIDPVTGSASKIDLMGLLGAKKEQDILYNKYLSNITGGDVSSASTEDRARARRQAEKDVYALVKDFIPPDTVLAKLTIPDDKIGGLIEFIFRKGFIPEEGGVSVSDAERKRIMDFMSKIKELEPHKRAQYLFNSMLFAFSDRPKGSSYKLSKPYISKAKRGLK